MSPHFEQSARHHSAERQRQDESHDRAGNDGQQSFIEYQPANVRRRGAEHDADAQPPGAARDRVRHHAVGTEHGELAEVRFRSTDQQLPQRGRLAWAVSARRERDLR